MAEEYAIWHVIVGGGAQQGPLTQSQVLEWLKGGTLVGSDLIWCPGFPDWKPVSEINEFRQRPPRITTEVNVPAPPQTVADQPRKSDKPFVGEKWSLWKSASVGLLVSAVTLLAQVASGRGFELADY